MYHRYRTRWDYPYYRDDWWYRDDFRRKQAEIDFYQSQIANVRQSIYNTGYMENVYQNSWINQVMPYRLLR